MRNVNIRQQEAVTVNGMITGNSQTPITRGDGNHGACPMFDHQATDWATSVEELAPARETYPRKHGFSWASAEKIDGIIDPKQHLDWVMMSQFGISLAYLIHFVLDLYDRDYHRNEAFEAVMAQFGFDEMHADIVSDSVFGEPFYALIADIHGWISDSKSAEDDDWARSKYGMQEYVVGAVLEELAFLKMDEVNPNP
jgi:hypothetical protein